MSKGTITEILGDGKYKVVQNMELTRYNAEKERLELQISQANEAEAAATIAETIANSKAETQWIDLDAAIDAYSADPSDTNKKTVDAHQALALQYQKEANEASVAVQRIALGRLSAIKRLDEIEGVIPLVPVELDAWCADYNVELAIGKEVGLIDIGREKDKILPTQLILPASDDGTEADYDVVRDGQFQSYIHADPNAVYYNTAILPGANKWKPRYRKGEIFSIDAGNDTAVVTIDALASTSQNLDVNQSPQVTADVVYMSCNAVAFEVGDRVVIAFVGQDWDQPQLIGFETNPRVCEANIVMLYDQLFTPSAGASGLDSYLSEIDQRNFNILSNYFQFDNLDLLGAYVPDFGQWRTGGHYTARRHTTIGITAAPRAISIYRDTTLLVEVGDDPPVGYYPEGSTFGSMANNNHIITPCRWVYTLSPSAITETYNNAFNFYDFAGVFIKAIDNTADDTVVFEGAASDDGLIILENLGGTSTFRMRLLDLDGVQLATEAWTFLGDSDVDATNSYFIFMTRPSAATDLTFYVYDLTGSLIATLTLPVEADPVERPPNFDGVAYWSRHITFCASDRRITVAYTYTWYYADGTPITPNNRSLTKIYQYYFDGTSLSFFDSSDFLSYNAVWEVHQIRNKNL